MRSSKPWLILLIGLSACRSNSQETAAPTPVTATAGAAGVTGAAGAAGVTGTAGAIGGNGEAAGTRAPLVPIMDAGTASDTDAEPAREPDAQSSTSDASAPDAASDDAMPPTDSLSCPKDALSAGDSSAQLMHDSRQRRFLIHVPRGYDNTRAVPLVLNFHGNTSNAEQQRSLFSQMDTTSDDKGFIVVYPEGTDSSWNAGACCNPAAANDVDDVGFARALVDYMKGHACIDPKRIYATGFSNGGRLSYRLGCEAADVFAAIAPVAGTKSFPDLENSPGCMPSRPLSLIDFMGSADSRIAAQPGQVKEWLGFNGCTDTEPTETYRQGNHYCKSYSKCTAGTSVTYCVIDGGGHCWPGSYPCPLGDTSRPDQLSANTLMWQLFERSTL